LQVGQIKSAAAFRWKSIAGELVDFDLLRRPAHVEVHRAAKSWNWFLPACP